MTYMRQNQPGSLVRSEMMAVEKGITSTNPCFQAER